MAKAKKTAKTGAKKIWYPILSPVMFNEQVVGEMPLYEVTDAIGRLIPINLMNLTGDIKRQNVNIIFKISNATSGKLYTEIIGYEMLTSQVRRLVRRGKNKVEYSLKSVTADGQKVDVKVVMITRSLTNLSYLTALRNTCDTEVKKLVSKTKYEDLVAGMVGYNFQMAIKKVLNKIYPLRSFDIRHLRLKGKGKVPVQKEEPAEAPKADDVESVKEALVEAAHEASGQKEEAVPAEIIKEEKAE